MRAFLVAAMVTLCSPAWAQASDPAVSTVANFDDALMASMHANGAPLQTAIGADFNVDVMAAFVVGPAWSGFSQSDQSSVTAALRRYLIARFADEFDSYTGEQFNVAANVEERGPDKLVHTQVVHQTGAPDHLDYRLRNYGGAWRIIDVYYNGVSQLTTQRADLASTPQTAAAIAARIDHATQALK